MEAIVAQLASESEELHQVSGGCGNTVGQEEVEGIPWALPKKDVLFIIGDWNAKVGSQETPGITSKFGLGIWNEAGQRLIEICQENALVIANTLFQQHKRRLYGRLWQFAHPRPLSLLQRSSPG